MDAEGNKLGCRRIANEPAALMAAVTEFATNPEVVVEATYGWYWAVTFCGTTAWPCIWPTRRATIGVSAG
jgi:hypothetical protein